MSERWLPTPGYITASVFNSCMTKSFGKTVLRECCRIACERLGVTGLAEQFDISGLRALEWGIENEPLAIAAYEAETFTTIHSRQEFVQIDGMMVGGHPDGLVGDEGMVEIKCPNSDNHLLNITEGSQIEDYKPQVQGYLWITGREWCDFISFDPRFPEDLQLHVRRVHRDEAFIESIKTRAAEMEAAIAGMVMKARPVLNGSAKAVALDQ
jgi:hypothetical protein